MTNQLFSIKHISIMKSKLITPELEKTLASYPIYSQDDKKKEAICVCAFELGGVRWYVLEAEKEKSGDYTFFGIVTGMYEPEYGYFSLSELEEMKVQIGKSPYFLLVTQVPSIAEVPIGKISDRELQEFLDDLYQ